jgi:hypothetical protein
LNLDEFVREIHEGIDIFSQNMDKLNRRDPKHAEEWMRLFTSWLEMT